MIRTPQLLASLLCSCLLGGCFAPSGVGLPAGAADGARSAALSIQGPGQQLRTVVFDPRGPFHDAWAASGAEGSSAWLRFYGCEPDALDLNTPGAGARDCLPATERRYLYDADQGWSLQRSTGPQRDCTRCEHFPIEYKGQADRPELLSAQARSLILLDEHTLLASAQRDSTGEVFLMRIGLEPGFPSEQLLIEGVPSGPLPTFSGMSRASDGTLFGVSDDSLWTIELEPGRAVLHSVPAWPDSIGSGRLFPQGGVDGDLVLGLTDGRVYERIAGSWSQRQGARAVGPEVKAFAETKIDLAPDSAGNIMIGVGQDASTYTLIDGVEIEVLKYYVFQGGQEVFVEMNDHEQPAALAQLDGQTYLLGKSGSIYRIPDPFRPGVLVSPGEGVVASFLRAVDQRLVVVSRDGALSSLFPGDDKACTPIQGLVSDELVVQGRTIVSLPPASLAIQWLEAKPVFDCALDAQP